MTPGDELPRAPAGEPRSRMTQVSLLWFVIVYLVSVLLAILASVLFWNERVNGVLYYCSERNPLDFLIGPPFTHSRPWATGDREVAPAGTVMWLWQVSWTGCFLVPAVFVWIGQKSTGWVARKMPALKSSNLMRGFLVSLFRWLALTALIAGGISFVIAWNAASHQRLPPRRHTRTYSHATITDVPLLTLLGPPKSLATRVAFSPDGRTIAAGF